MAFELPKLPYEKDALEPYITKETVEYHYGKHHQGYVNKVNAQTEGTEFADASLEDIIKHADGGIFNNGAQVWNHTFYWESMKPKGGGAPKGELAKAIDEQFGSFDRFKDQFSNAAATLFGSGWAWLAKDAKGKLEIIQKSNAGNPIRDEKTPLLVIDVWEHAYYLKDKNKRPDYIAGFWNLVNWDEVEKRYNK